MKRFATIVLVLSLVCSSIALTALQSLRTITSDELAMNPVREYFLLNGRVDYLLFGHRIWNMYPAMPPLRFFPGVFVEWMALATALISIGVGLMIVRYTRQQPGLILMLAPWVGTAILCIAGISALQGNTNSERCGPWLVAMLLSMLYSAIAGVFFSWRMHRDRNVCAN